ncbi:MAG: hypothetical protein Q9170_000820 [Blastenia crenularia]
MPSRPTSAPLQSQRELGEALCELKQHQYPHVLNPPGCKKRASVALIIRVRPTFPDRASFEADQCGREAGTDLSRLEAFFSQGWVQRGDPEVLFIKRAARQGDRWTSHIAFPGGRRDPEDEDDAATSVRETQEEIGLDLGSDYCLQVGNLSERIVTAWLGKTPYRRRKLRQLDSTVLTSESPGEGAVQLSGPGEIDDTTFTTPRPQRQGGVQDSALLEALGGYYPRAKVAVFFTLALRLGTAGLLATWAIHQLRNRSSARYR